GHTDVTERHYDGATTGAALLQEIQHWFYQGGASCNLASMLLTSGSTQYVDESNSCYQLMVQREGWKGKEYQTEVRANGSTLMQRTSHSSIQYDSLGRKSNLLNPSLPAMRDPDMGDWNYTYNVNGTLASQTDARGQTISFGYDDLDRLTSKTYPDSTQALY